MKPRSCGRAALLLSLFALSAAWMGFGREARAQAPLNVLLIAVDDLNDWIGPLDQQFGVKTPNLDRLARRSVLFSRAYCAAPACNPSRAALLTGVRPSTSGVYHNNQPWRPALPDAITLPQHFRNAGYEVVGGGKIFHGGWNDTPAWNEYQRVIGSPNPPMRPVNGIKGTAQFDWGPVDVPDEAMGDHKISEWALGQIAKPRTKPLFLAVGFTRPHLPWYVPRKYFDMYPLDSVKLPKVDPKDLADVPDAGVRMAGPNRDHAKVVESGQWAKGVQAYLASITFADMCIGRVLDGLERSPMAANTVVVLWGDHGWHLGEKEHWRKFALWEEATRTPLFFAAPGIKAAQSDKPVSLMDIYPTLIELAGAPKNVGLEAVSLAPLLRDPKTEWDRPVITTHGRNNHAVRTQRWRYIRYADGDEELYDHNSDPLEWKNLARDPAHAEVKKELAKALPEKNAPDAQRGRGAD
jgi:arylsulfatase A-like enzyme